MNAEVEVPSPADKDGRQSTPSRGKRTVYGVTCSTDAVSELSRVEVMVFFPSTPDTSSVPYSSR
jgi:hypothetical protein